MLDLVKNQLKGSEEPKNDQESFSWEDKTVEERNEALADAERKYDLNIAQTDAKIDLAVRMGLITEEEAQELTNVQESYLVGLYFHKPISKVKELEKALYGLPVDEIEASENYKGLLSFVREKAYFASLMCIKMDNINLVEFKQEEREANARRQKAREKTPELDDYYEKQPDTSKKEDAPKGKGRRKRRK